jgi:predicted PurR-regulated permease PerM
VEPPPNPSLKYDRTYAVPSPGRLGGARVPSGCLPRALTAYVLNMKGANVASSHSPRIEPPIQAGALAASRTQADHAVEAAQVPEMAPPAEERAIGPALPDEPAGVAVVQPEAAAAQPFELSYPSGRTLARWLLVLLALYAVGWLLWNARPALTPFIIGLVLAFLMMPIVNRLDRKMPRWFAILTVYVGGIVVLITAVNYIIPLLVSQIQQLIESFPRVDQVQNWGNMLLQEYRDLVPAALQQPIEDGARNALQTLQANVTTYLQSVGTFILNQVIQVINTLTFLVGFLIIPIWLFYVVNDVDQGRSFVDGILHPRIKADFWNVWNIISKVLNDYIRGQLVLGLAVGLMVGLGLLSLRLFGIEVPYILILALIAGITELIPIIGPIIGAIPGVLIGFFGGEGGLQAGLAVLAIYIIVQQLENNFLVPRIIGESIGIHPAILTVVLIAMGQIFGLLGVVLAAPVAAIGRDLFNYTYRRLEGMTPAMAQQSIAMEAPENEEITKPG